MNTQLPKFKEILPNDCCPPKAAEAPSEQEVVRIVKAKTVDEADFKSHHALGLKCPLGVDPCKWSACSLWGGRDAVQSVLGLPQLPKLRTKLTHLAWLKINANSGVASMNRRNGHISLWMFD